MFNAGDHRAAVADADAVASLALLSNVRRWDADARERSSAAIVEALQVCAPFFHAMVNTMINIAKTLRRFSLKPRTDEQL